MSHENVVVFIHNKHAVTLSRYRQMALTVLIAFFGGVQSNMQAAFSDYCAEKGLREIGLNFYTWATGLMSLSEETPT